MRFGYHIQEAFSVDTAGHMYRVEIYCGKKFSGMVLVDFGYERESLIASHPAEVSPSGATGERHTPAAEGASVETGNFSSLGR